MCKKVRESSNQKAASSTPYSQSQKAMSGGGTPTVGVESAREGVESARERERDHHKHEATTQTQVCLARMWLTANDLHHFVSCHPREFPAMAQPPWLPLLSVSTRSQVHNGMQPSTELNSSRPGRVMS